MRPVTAAALQALRSSATMHTRLQLLDQDDSPIDELSGADGYVLDAKVSMDRLRRPVRSVSNLSIANPRGLFTPRALVGELGIGRRFALDNGVELADGSIEWFNLGLFVVDRPRVADPDEELTLQASDYWKLGFKRKLRESVTFDKGTRLEDVALRLAPLAGFRTDRLRLNDSDVVLGVTIVLPFGADVLAALERIVDEHDHEVYADWDGWLVLRHAPRLCGSSECRASLNAHLGGLDEEEAPFPLAPGEDAVLLGVTKDWNDERLYNAVAVVAQGMQRPTVSAEWRNLNPSSPAYNPPPGYDLAWPLGGGPLGDRLLAVQYTSRLADEFACYQYAQHLGFENGQVEETYSLDLASLPFLEQGDQIAFTHPESDSDTTVLIDAINMGTDPTADQSLAIKQLRWLSAPD